MESICSVSASMVFTVLVVGTLATGVGVWRSKRQSALQGALIAAAVAIGAASVVFVMLLSYHGDSRGQAIPWIEQTGVAIAGISAGSFVLCIVFVAVDLIDRIRRRGG